MHRMWTPTSWRIPNRTLCWTPNPDVVEDASTDADPDVAGDAKDDADGEDVGADECLQVDIGGLWDIDFEDDVSISYSAPLDPSVMGGYGILTMLFERYEPGPDVGGVALGEGRDDNFGNCAHCLYMPGLERGEVFFADSGVMDIRQDPYGRTLDITVTGLRLIEVTVDGETRESTPIDGGRCVEVAEFTATGTFPETGWTCDQALFDDGEVCNCECGAYDPDCDVVTVCPPFNPTVSSRSRSPSTSAPTHRSARSTRALHHRVHRRL